VKAETAAASTSAELAALAAVTATSAEVATTEAAILSDIADVAVEVEKIPREGRTSLWTNPTTGRFTRMTIGEDS
jgi:hypothetical protein